MRVVDTILLKFAAVAVHDRLDFVVLSEEELRQKYSDRFPTIQAVPGAVILANPEDKQIVVIRPDRTDWADESQAQFDRQVLIQTMSDLMTFLNADVRAVGGNYDFRLVCDEPARRLLVGLLADQEEALSQAIDGTIESCGIRLVYQRNSLRYDLRIEMIPDGENALLTRLNVHDEGGTVEQLGNRMDDDMAYVKETMSALCSFAQGA